MTLRTEPGSGHDVGRPAAGSDIADALLREVQRVRTLVHDLRNPVGAVGMAVEMLTGPLAKVREHLDPKVAASLERTLDALVTSTQQITHLVSHEDRHERFEIDALSSSIEDSAVSPPPAAVVSAANEPPKPEARRPEDATPRRPEIQRRTNVSDLLRKLEILTVTRSALPALIAVQCRMEIAVAANGPELLRALSNLVENAIEASAEANPGSAPWTVKILCELESDGACVFRIRNIGNPPSAEVRAWLEKPSVAPGDCPPSHKDDGRIHGLGLASVRRVVEANDGTLRAKNQGGETEFCLRLPKDRVLEVESA